MSLYLKKYFIPYNYFRFLKAHLFPRNLIIDRVFKQIHYDKLKNLQNVRISCLNIHSNDYERWINQFFPSWYDRYGHVRHKKLIEFYSTFRLLKTQASDVFMDAAGGRNSYLKDLKCKKRFLQDIKISTDVKSRLGKDVEYIEGDVGHLSLPSESVDKISCHHSFEHFQADSDILFIKEIQRLLRVDGKCAIIPIFFADLYLELTDIFSFKRKHDNGSRFIIDPTATIPGGRSCGNYARIYDIKAFQERIINNVDTTKFKVIIVELKIDGNTVPDMTLDCHKSVAKVNFPYRAMIIERFM